ncbi:20107_t:CDS:2, partial [Gigaspora margarita]
DTIAQNKGLSYYRAGARQFDRSSTRSFRSSATDLTSEELWFYASNIDYRVMVEISDILSKQEFLNYEGSKSDKQNPTGSNLFIFS